jgi:2-hydroxychromene-2-carboxylate isomerase
MGIGSRIKGRAIATFLGPAGQKARGLVAGVRRVVTREPRRLDFYHDLSDPWSHLTAQAVERLLRVYQIDFAFHFVAPPEADVAPEPAMRLRHGVRDARELAAFWDLEFDGKKEPDPTLLRKASSALIRERPAAEQLAASIALGNALWSGDHKAMDALLGKLGTETTNAIAPATAAAYAALRDRGHYQGAMIGYGGEWYWGIDRLGHLERELAEDTGTSTSGVISRRPDAQRGPLRLAAGNAPLVLDLWFSFRSPYSYLALERIADAIAPFPVELRLRPVPPMVDRGLPMPKVKRMYIVRDAKREADRLGIPFGNICDPLGQGVTNALAVAKFAIATGKGLDFARSALRGTWSEARDLASYVDLRHVVERAGLAWDDARAAIGDPEAGSWASANATDLGVIGLWGVPSFRVGDLNLWGQDRLDILVDRLRRHVAAVRSDAASQDETPNSA